MNQETKKCQNCKKDFVIDQEDFNFYEKMDVPLPTFCPLCRAQRRMAFRNERTFYKRPCSMCNKDMISLYADNSPFPVYCHECWWSDKLDATSFGRDFDFSRPFFEQFKEFELLFLLFLFLPVRVVRVVRGKHTLTRPFGPPSPVKGEG